MKSTKPKLMVIPLLLFAIASGSVLAHGPRVHFGIGIGGPAFWPGYYYAPPYYYPPVVVSPASPPVYIEQGAPQAAPAPSVQGNWWYYCDDAKAYYPHVKECPAGWLRVAPLPSS